MERRKTLLVLLFVTIILVSLVSLLFILEPVQAASVTIQPSSADSMIYEYSPGNNFGSYSYLYVMSSNSRNLRCLVQFALSAIPSGVAIDSAQLKLYMYDAPATSRLYQAYRITGPWTEAAVTWNSRPTLAASPSASVSTGTSSGVWLSWDVTGDVQGWVSGSFTNYGMLIRDSEEDRGSAVNALFRSKEYSTASVRPMLEVTYTTWDFSISASPPGQTVTKGTAAYYDINLALVTGSTQPVSLSLTGQDGTMTYDFTPPSVTPTGGSLLEVGTTGSTPDGDYVLTITASGGGLTRQTTVTLEVISGPDFTISATPSSRTVSSGASTTYAVTLTSIGGFSESLSLNVAGLPTDATGTFNPPNVTPTGTSTLTVSTAPTTPGGTYTLTITGSNGGLTHSTTVELVVVGPESFTFDVRPGATQIIVTMAWTGQGTAMMQLQSPTTTYTEAGMTMYEKTTVDVEDGTRTYTGIKRALHVITPPATTESWTLLISLSGITTYQVNIEVT